MKVFQLSASDIMPRYPAFILTILLAIDLEFDADTGIQPIREEGIDHNQRLPTAATTKRIFKGAPGQ